MPSAPPPQPASKPAQRSRKTLIAVIAGAALLGLGATVLVVALGGREEPAPRVENAPPSAAPAVADGPSVALDEVRPPAAVDVTSPPMAGRVDASPPSALTRSDAASPMPGRIDAAAPARPDAAPPPARPDAVTPPMRPDAGAQPVRSDAASPSSAGEVIGVDRPTTPDYKALVVPNPRAFDPQAYYKTALAEANRLSGGAAPIMIRWHHVDRSGKIDVAGGGSAMYDFASAERIRANDPTCLVSVSIEAKNPHAARGSFSNDPDACKRQRALAPPKCTGEQLWEKALATGKVPDDAKHATLSHNYARGWVFSTEGSDAIDLPDDCP